MKWGIEDIEGEGSKSDILVDHFSNEPEEGNGIHGNGKSNGDRNGTS